MFYCLRIVDFIRFVHYDSVKRCSKSPQTVIAVEAESDYGGGGQIWRVEWEMEAGRNELEGAFSHKSQNSRGSCDCYCAGRRVGA